MQSMYRADELMNILLNIFREEAPKDTGNLAYAAIRLEERGSGIYAIVADENIAPYMKYTNENWSNFAYPLQGKKNPNEHWFDKTVQIAINMLATLLGGFIKSA